MEGTQNVNYLSTSVSPGAASDDSDSLRLYSQSDQPFFSERMRSATTMRAQNRFALDSMAITPLRLPRFVKVS